MKKFEKTCCVTFDTGLERTTMSRTQKKSSRGKNPTKRFLRWHSSEKQWGYWDAESETRELVAADTRFVVLDQLSTVTGFDPVTKSAIWANEIRTLREELSVFSGKKPLGTGTWAEIKASVPGVKFASSVYAMVFLPEGPVLGNFRMSGAAIGGWIDFTKEVGRSKLEGDSIISATQVKQGKTGSVVYYSPVFSIVGELNPSEGDLADSMDMELQEYLAESTTRKLDDTPLIEDDEDDDIPF